MVAALLLLRDGYEVIGLTVDTGHGDVSEGSQAARELGIPHITADYRKDFKEYVTEYLVSEYLSGRTPNPCAVCNRRVKWPALIEAALDADAMVATGHYAVAGKHPLTGRYAVRESSAGTKDQTYMLYGLGQETLERALFPLGCYGKPEVRRIAAERGLSSAGKPDSQDICFIKDGDMERFIKENSDAGSPPGKFTDPDGNALGMHGGIAFYTPGQRKGIRIPGGFRRYVKKIDAESNTVVLSAEEELFSTDMTVSEVAWMAYEPLAEGAFLTLKAKIRSAHTAADCAVKYSNGRLACEFAKPQRAVAPGQSAVFYDEYGYVACGGVID